MIIKPIFAKDASISKLERDFGGDFKGKDIGDIINLLVQYLFVIVGLALLLYLLAGGFSLIFSKGDPQKAQAAKDRITNALTGFIIIFVAYWLVQAIGKIFGIEVISDIFGLGTSPRTRR